MSAEDRKVGAVDAALTRLELAGGRWDGGYLIQVREALGQLWDDGRIEGSWEPAPILSAQGEAEPESDAVSALKGWWEQTAHDEVANLTAKMVEYGGLHRATDLEEIGRGLIKSGVKAGLELDSDDESAMFQELGCYFYLLGKFARWTAAVAEGRPVSDDTLLDIGIYVRMVQRIRAVGGWPV